MSGWGWFAVAATVFVLICWSIGAHNALMSMQTTVVESWRGVGVELTRRWELIPRLAEVARSYAAHESLVLTRLVRHRHPVPVDGDPPTALRELSVHVLAEEARSDTDLTEALAGLRAVSEAHPELQASQHYIVLMTALRDTDDRVAAARRLYNGNVSRYNARLRSFPGSILARRSGMAAAEFFDVVSPEHAGVPPLHLPSAGVPDSGG